MRTTSILIPFSLILVTLYPNVLSQQTPPLIDADGNDVAPSNLYNLVKVPRGEGGAVTTAFPPNNPTSCPINVILFPPDGSGSNLIDGATSYPVAFQRKNTSDTVIRESDLLRIQTRFPFRSPCPAYTLYWRAHANDGSTSANFIHLDGCNTGPMPCDSSHEWFKFEPVEDYEHAYKLVSSLQVSPYDDFDVAWNVEEGDNKYGLFANVEGDTEKEVPAFQFVKYTETLELDQPQVE